MANTESINLDKLLCVGIIVTTNGLKGKVKIKTFTEFPENIIKYECIFNENGEKLNIKHIELRKANVAIITIEGIESIKQAQSIINSKLFIKEGMLGKTNENEFYPHEIIGMKVTLEDGSNYGQVKTIANFGAGDIIEIIPTNDANNLMLPFTYECFPIVDIENNCLVVKIPDIAHND